MQRYFLLKIRVCKKNCCSKAHVAVREHEREPFSHHFVVNFHPDREL